MKDTIDLKARRAAEKRFTKYRQILLDTSNRYAGPLSLANAEILAKVQNYHNNTIQYLAVMLWQTLMLERQSLFRNLTCEDYKQVSEHQRGYYATLRFCMETVADLNYLCSHPKDLKAFLTSEEEIEAETLQIQTQDIPIAEKDKLLADLTLKGKINSRITTRIAETFPGFMYDYGMFCMHTHLSMQGLRIFCAPAAVDLLFNKTALIIRTTFETMFCILDTLGMINEDAELMFRNVDRVMLECDRAVTNLYYGKDDPRMYFSDQQMAQMHNDFCNRKVS